MLLYAGRMPLESDLGVLRGPQTPPAQVLLAGPERARYDEPSCLSSAERGLRVITIPEYLIARAYLLVMHGVLETENAWISCVCCILWPCEWWMALIGCC